MTLDPWSGPADPVPTSPRAGPDVPVTDIDRQRAADLLQQVCGEGRLTLDDFSSRVGAVWSADTAGELERATSGIALPQVGAGGPSSGTLVSILGDQKRVGRWRLPRRLRLFALLGDWELDLRGALLSRDAVGDGVVDILHVSLLGDVKIIVPEGVEVELYGFELLGDRKLELAAVPITPGAPRVRLRAYGLLGDVIVRSAPS
jgi:Domain of unknown function (DUF1707)